eukprot:Nitzschia sp. Nitz4//scaffold156_size52432//43165//44166//NITZ4_006831-RA/size52432-processed-gene-0.54-mRNA-1//-1//CDS//3329537427//961//frame0
MLRFVVSSCFVSSRNIGSDLFLGLGFGDSRPPKADEDDMSTTSLDSFRFEEKTEQACQAIKAVAVKPFLDVISPEEVVIPHILPESKPSTPKPKCYVSTPKIYSKQDSFSYRESYPSRDYYSSSLIKAQSSSMRSLDLSSSSLPLVEATPVVDEGTESEPANDFKDEIIEKQAKEIEELKAMVTQMVSLLNDTLQQQEEAKAAAPVETAPLSPALVEVPANVDPASEVVATSVTKTSALQLACQRKSAKGTLSKSSKVRHVPVTIGGQVGYYSGPSLESAGPWKGCVVRFDNGDLYLGEMGCFNQEYAFHGWGTLTKKDGKVSRGRFSQHQLI